jgi:Bacterial Ig-like domain
MNKKSLIYSSFSLFFVMGVMSAADIVQVSSTPGSGLVVISATPVSVVVDAGLTLTNTSTTAITVATVVVGSGSDAGIGLDALALPITSGFTSSFDTATSSLSINATVTKNANEWQSALRTVTFTTASRIARARTVSFALGSAKPLSSNGHFYENINANAAITWQNARDAAAASRLYGLQGYLATITSAAENTFIVAKVQNDAWIGAVDDAVEINAVINPDYADQAAAEGNWYWVTGPEAGQLFFRGAPASPVGAVNGAFTYWAGGEPNDFGAPLGSENCAHIRFSGGAAGRWNDYAFNNSAVRRYVVEYGGMPGDPAVVLQASRTISVEWSAPSISAPSGTQALARPVLTGIAANAAGTGKIELGVDLTNDGSIDVVFITTCAANGTWSINTASATPISGVMADLGPSGTTRVTARTFNASSNTSSGATANPGPLSTAVFTTDRVPPAAPVLSGPTSPITTTTPTLRGNAEPGATVTLTIDPDGDPLTNNSYQLVTTTGADGAWSVAVPSGQPLINGTTASISASATDGFGNTSTATTTSLAVDTTAPAAPVVTGPGALTNDRTPLITGSAEAGALVTVVVDPDNNPATANSLTWVTVADSNGVWFIDTSTTPTAGSLPSGGLPETTVGISATARDGAGNVSAATSATTLIDATPPSAPVISGPQSPTNDTTPALTGTGEAGATLTMKIDIDGDLTTTSDIVTFTVVVAADGSWVIDTGTVTPSTGSMPGAGFADGHLVVLSANQTDPAGNTGPNASKQLAIDTTPPSAPLVLSPGPVTNNVRPTISGSAEPGSVVRVVLDTDGDPTTDSDRITLTTTADPLTGAWSVIPSSDLTDGSVAVLAVTATDSAGNIGPAASATVVIDTTAPVPPTLTGPVPTTRSATPILSGNIDDDTTTLVVTVDPNGDGDLSDQRVYTLTRGAGLPLTGTTWSLNLATAIPNGGNVPAAGLSDAAIPIISLAASDLAANTSSAGGFFTVDLSAPVAPLITAPGAASADRTPVIAGTAEAHALITVVVGGVTFTTVADNAGNWLVDTGTATPINGSVPSGGFPNGVLAISATATDPAGNTSNASVDSTIIDTLAPAKPIITGPGTLVVDTTPLITGTAEVGAIVTVTIDPDANPATNNSVVYTVTADGSGAWSVDTGSAIPMSGTFTPLAIGDAFTVQAQASDSAGNSSASAQVSSRVVGGSGVAVVTMPSADRLYTGQPQALLVTVNPSALALRIRWRLASDPLAIPVEFDPAISANAVLWPSTAGTYTVEAVVLESGWSGQATATLLIYAERNFNLHENRCGSGALFAGLLMMFTMLFMRGGRQGISTLVLITLAASHATAEDVAPAPTPAPTPVAPTSVNETAPVSVSPAAATFPASATPSNDVLPAWWILRVGLGPQTEDASEQRSGAVITKSEWRPGLRFELLREMHYGWTADDCDGLLIRLGGTLQTLSGDEEWRSTVNGDQLRYQTTGASLLLTAFVGWEAHLSDHFSFFAGPRGGLGPVLTHVDGVLTAGSDQWSDDTYAYGWKFSYGIEGGIGWRSGAWGVEVSTGYERQRTSLSYQLDNTLDTTDRGDTWDRRLNTIGWWGALGVSHAW